MRKRIESIECDQCGAQVPFDDFGSPVGWCSLRLQESAGMGGGVHKDFCCAEHLVKWLQVNDKMKNGH